MLPALARQRAGGAERIGERLLGGIVAGDEILDAPPQPAGAAAPAGLDAEQPAPEIRGLLAGERQREGAVGGVEDVMPLIEDVAVRQISVVEPAERRLDHDEGVVGDDDAGAPCLAHALLDEAFVVVRAGGVDALAAPVGEAERAAAAEHVGQPAGEVATADDVAVAAARQPAGDEAERDGIVRPHRQLRYRLLEIQQADIILAALAQHHLARFDRGIGIEAVELAGDLVLQVARIGRDPHDAFVLLGPETGRRDIAQRLADAGTGLGEDGVGLTRRGARQEGLAHRVGIVGLLRPCLGASAEQLGQATSRLGGLDRQIAGRRLRRVLGPFRQAAPHCEPGRRRVARSRDAPLRDARAWRSRSQRRQHRLAPAPAAARHRRGDQRRVLVGRGIGELGEQGLRGGDETERGIGEAGRPRQAERGGEAARRRQAEARRPGEGEELEEIEGGKGRNAKAPRHRPAVAEERRLGPRALHRLGEIQRRDLAVAGQPDRLAQADDESGRVGHEEGDRVHRTHTVRPSRRARWALLRMRYTFNATNNSSSS